MLPDDPRHGTYTGYQNHGCRCFPCRLARSQRMSERRSRSLPATVSAEAAREHIEEWRRTTGAGQVKFARVSGLSESVVRRILVGNPRIRRATHDAVVSVPLGGAVLRADEVPSWPTHRRIHALAAIGWSMPRQSEMIGRSPMFVCGIVAQDVIKKSTAEMISDLYERLSMSLPPETTKGERVSASKSRAWAKSEGHPPPLAWNDIDDPDERPSAGGDRKLYRADELLAEFNHLTGLGVSAHHAAKQLGVTTSAIEKARERTQKDSEAA